MAKKNPPDAAKAFRLGDHVRIKGLAGQIGRITELRGPLGPGGSAVYRVKIPREPRSTFIELLGDQLELHRLAEQVGGGSRRKAASTPTKTQADG